MKFCVEHNHQGNVNLNVEIVIRSELSKEEKLSAKGDEHPKESLQIVVGTLYLGIFSSLFAVFLDNQLKNEVTGPIYTWIIFVFALLFLLLGFGYTFYGSKFDKIVFKSMIKITYGIVLVLVAVALSFIILSHF